MLFGNYITYNNEFSKGALSLGLNQKFTALRFLRFPETFRQEEAN